MANTSPTPKPEKYATFNPESGELKIGRDVPGLASHGAAVSVGQFDDEQDAREYAATRGMIASRFSVL